MFKFANKIVIKLIIFRFIFVFINKNKINNIGIKYL